MSDPIIQSLWVTLLGMGIVFVAIILLWGLMFLITAIRLERKQESGQPVAEDANKALAAATAVAAAFALARQAEANVSIFPPPPTAFVSAWQLSRRGENLVKQGKVRR